MDALLLRRASIISHRACKSAALRVFTRCFDLSSLPQPGPYVRMRLHPEWKQFDNRIRRMESRIADFRILCNDVRLHKNRLEAGDSAMPASRLETIIKEKEAEVVKERAAIISDLQNMTATFVEGATREYVSLRKFFLLYLYHTMRLSFESLSDAEFERMLTEENPDGVTFEAPNKGSVTFPIHLCRKLAAAGKNLFVNTAGVETTTIAIALAIVQAPPLKHCSYPNCKREDCIAVKSDYEQLFEIFFKEKPRTLGFQKARGEMSAEYDVVLSLPSKDAKKEPEPAPIKRQASLRID